jgi:hypothetical protein
MSPKTVQPLPLEGAPEKFNPKARRSSAPANMQIRFKIDKRKGLGTNSSLGIQSENLPNYNSESITDTNPQILISPPDETYVL